MNFIGPGIGAGSGVETLIEENAPALDVGVVRDGTRSTSRNRAGR
jgi:hypothetical protein